MRRAIDDDLRQDAAAFSSQAVPRGAQRPATIAASVRRYLATQPAFGESARLFVVRVPGGPIVTNEPELVARDDRDRAGESIQQRAREATDASRIRAAPLGYATFDLTEAGGLRLLTRPIVRSGRTVAIAQRGGDAGVGATRPAGRDQGAFAGRLAHAGGRDPARRRAGRTHRATPAAHGPHRGEGRRRRPRPAHSRPGAARRDPRARRRLRPHARSPRGRVRGASARSWPTHRTSCARR